MILIQSNGHFFHITDHYYFHILKYIFLMSPGRWFRPPDSAGSCRKDAGKSPDPAGKHRKSLEHGSSILTQIVRIFSSRFLCFPARNGQKSPGKIRKISGRNTASSKSLELPRTGRFQAGLFDLGPYKFMNSFMHYFYFISYIIVIIIKN